MMNELSALLLDVDGTIADTEELHRQAFNSAFTEFGLDWNWSRDLYTELLSVTGGKERIRHYIDCYLPDFTPPDDLPEFIARMHELKTVFYIQTVEQGRAPLRPGVERLICEARAAGLRRAIATTTSPENVQALLGCSFRKASVSWFDVIAAGNAVKAKKPAPDIYRLALAELGLPPQSCLAIEDSVNGLRAASDSGIRTLITVNHYTRHENFEGAVLVLDQLGDPGNPFEVIQGDARGWKYVDVALLKRLHERTRGPVHTDQPPDIPEREPS